MGVRLATKAKKRRPLSGDALLGPTPERWERGEIELVNQAIADEEGRPSQPFRAIDTLADLWKRRVIDDAMLAAGRSFQDDFDISGLETLHAADLGRTPGNGRLEPSNAAIDARTRIYEAMTALGGLAAPASLAIWWVVGVRLTVKKFAERQRWGGRSMNQMAASGLLVGALSALAAHYDRR